MLRGDAAELPRVLTQRPARAVIGSAPAHPAGIEPLPFGRIDLIVTSPPYGCDVGEIDKRALKAKGHLCQPETRNYGSAKQSIGHTRGDLHRTAVGRIYAACATVLKPGGFLVIVTKDTRREGVSRNLAGETVRLCQCAGLLYWQHIIALLATINDGQLIPRPSFWQRPTTPCGYAR